MGSPPTTPPRVMRGADGSNAGASGYAPAPAATDNNKALFGDAQWRAVSGTGTAATKAEADAGTDTAKYVAPDALSYALAAKRNALAPRGGLAFDGTASTRVYSTLTNQTIGTDAFSLSCIFRVPTTNPSADVDVMALSSNVVTTQASSSFAVGLSTTGVLSVYIVNAAATATRNANISGFISGYAGKVIHLTVTRSGTTLTIYINGVSATYSDTGGGTGIAWSDTVTSTYMLQGFRSSGVIHVGTIYTASLYNLALTQADVTEIVELGGAVPERFKFGSQVNRIANTSRNSDFSAGATDWAANVASLSAAAGALVVTVPGGGAWYISLDGLTRSTGSVFFTKGKRYRVRFDVSGFSGLTGVFVSGGAGVNSFGAITANGSYDLSADYTDADWGRYMQFQSNTTTAGSITLDNISVLQLGAVIHFDADPDGIGYQLHDQSTNKLHALLTTTGVSWSKAATMGYVKVLSDGTTSAQALGGGTILPANCQIIRVRARSISGTPSITLGTASGGSQIVASVALSTTWKDLTIALTGGINSSANSLWMTASAANVVEVQLAYEQLPA